MVGVLVYSQAHPALAQLSETREKGSKIFAPRDGTPA
jgi:hypothetical protein